MSSNFNFDFSYALGKPEATAKFRVCNEDFKVDEQLGFEPSGAGEHVLLHIEKTGENTVWVAKQIAALANVSEMDIGYCGRKDRHAVTKQWFSVYLPKLPAPEWTQLNSSTTNLLFVARHNQKLRRGQHALNHFVIRLRDIDSDHGPINARLERIMKEGVPSYFGEQRFGHDGNNLVVANEILVEGKRIKNKQSRGFAISAARSYLYNLVLSARVQGKTWNSLLEGEVIGSQEEGSPNGPLWGRGRLQSEGKLRELEDAVLAPWQAWCERLEYQGLNQERRPLVLMPKSGEWRWEGNDLFLEFSLPVGAFATSLLRELVLTESVSA